MVVMLLEPDFHHEIEEEAALPGFACVAVEGEGTVPPLSPPPPPTLTEPAYEMKFLLRAEQAERVENWARQHLAPDPHGKVALNGAYPIQSVYFDTEALDVYHQSPAYRRRKFRLRRYGDVPDVYLERKSKSKGQVSKQLTLVNAQELSRLLETTPDAEWAGHWFHSKVLTRQLKPRCLFHFERVAYSSKCNDGPMRLKLDRNIHCAPVAGYGFEPVGPSRPLLTEEVILELRFRAALPALFKRLIQEQGLNPSGVSKYRRGIEACQLIGKGEEAD